MSESVAFGHNLATHGSPSDSRIKLGLRKLGEEWKWKRLSYSSEVFKASYLLLASTCEERGSVQASRGPRARTRATKRLKPNLQTVYDGRLRRVG